MTLYWFCVFVTAVYSLEWKKKNGGIALTTVTIDLPEEQATVLSQQADAQGVSLQELIRKKATEKPQFIDWSQCPAVESVPGKVSGAWVLKGSRMPVSAIFENLEAGANIDEILEWFRGLDKAQVQEVVEFAARSLDRPPSYGA
jgi:uncharacterized protein (DUF433 family)